MSEAAPAATAAVVTAEAPVERAEKPQEVKSPSDFLKGVLGRSVVVRLNSGVEYRGTLPAYLI
jgi:hypothetical protein